MVIFSRGKRYSFLSVVWNQANINCQTKGRSLEDIAEVFGDNTVLEDEHEEAIYRRFKESHHQEKTIIDSVEVNL
jgi:uncharacterized DUF497 family protein